MPVIFFPDLSDRESREGGATEVPAIISMIVDKNDDDDTRVSLRVFNHSTDGGNVPLRRFVPHRESVNSVAPYWITLEEFEDDEDERKNPTSKEKLPAESDEESQVDNSDVNALNEGGKPDPVPNEVKTGQQPPATEVQPPESEVATNQGDGNVNDGKSGTDPSITQSGSTGALPETENGASQTGNEANLGT